MLEKLGVNKSDSIRRVAIKFLMQFNITVKVHY